MVMLSFSTAVLLHTVPSFPNIASVQLHRLVYILISDHITITMLKTTVHKQLFLQRHTCALELSRRECEWQAVVGWYCWVRPVIVRLAWA